MQNTYDHHHLMGISRRFFTVNLLGLVPEMFQINTRIVIVKLKMFDMLKKIPLDNKYIRTCSIQT